MKKNGESGRRRFIRRLATLGAAGGVAALLFGHVTEKPLLPPVQAAGSLTIDALNNGAGTTELDSTLASSNSGAAFKAVTTATTAQVGQEPTGVYGEVLVNGGTWQDGPWPYGVYGYASAQSGATTGVYGRVDSPNGEGIWGYSSASTGLNWGVYGTSISPDGTGVYGYGGAATGNGFGVFGDTNAPNGTGVYGYARAAGGYGTGVIGETGSTEGGCGVLGWAGATSGAAAGVMGISRSPQGVAVQGESRADGGAGLFGGGWHQAPGATLITAWAASGQTAPLQEWFRNDWTPLAVIDKDGQLGLGTGSPLVPLHIKSASSNPALRIENENQHVGQFIYCFSNGNIPFFSGRRARGTMASPSAVQDNDTLMRYGGSGYGSTTFPGGNRAILEFRAAETWTDGAQGTYITFMTTPTGSTATAERVRIDDAGNLLPMSDNAYNCGDDTHRWKLLRAQTVTSGDLAFENGYRVTEDEKAGLAFKNDAGEKIAVLDREGNWHIKGKVMEDL